MKPKVLQLIKIIEEDPLQYPPDYEFLKGDMKGLISRRINKQHWMVYGNLAKGLPQKGQAKLVTSAVTAFSPFD